MGLTHLAERQAGALSYGDVALLEIGMTLISDPRLLLLDEPTCGMSPAETERAVKTFATWQRRSTSSSSSTTWK